MSSLEILILILAGIMGGGVNAIAGGGTFFTFPALMVTGLDPVSANISSAVAIYPGHAMAVGAYRKELAQEGGKLFLRGLIAAFGGLVGAVILISTDAQVFSSLVPLLILSATLLFALGPTLHKVSAKLLFRSRILTGFLEFLTAIYGGYFGAGLGVLVMASLSIVGVKNIHSVNAQKNLIATIITTISAATYLLAGAIVWPQTLCVLIGAIFGGYVGAYFARKIPTWMLRVLVVAIGLGLTAYYFYST